VTMTHPPAANPPAVQLYTVREQLAGDRKGILARIAGFGYGAVEPFNILSDPAGLREDLDAAGLVACSVHATPSGEQAAPLLQAARTLGADTIIVPYMPPARFTDRASVQALAGELNEIAARTADQGLRLELASIVDGRPALEVLADALDDPAEGGVNGGVLLEVDTYWAAVGGQDVPALLGRLGDRVRYLHVKDGPVTRDDPMTAVGAGRMPVAEILAAGAAAEWHVVELDQCATDMMTAVGESLAWLAAHGLAQPVARRPGA
jgi:sugar phosphate isomerase/epimerase